MPLAWAYGILMVIVGAAVQLFAVSATVYVQKTAPEAQRGHALSAYNAGFMGFVPVGSFVVAGLAAAAGTRWALIGPGAAIVVCGAIALAGTAHGRRHSRIPDPGPGRPGKIALNETPSERSFHMTACGITYCPRCPPRPAPPPVPRSGRTAQRPRVRALRDAFPARSPLLPALTRSLRAASMFPTSPPHRAIGRGREHYSSATRVNRQEGGPIRKRTGGKPGTPRAPLAARFQVFPQTPIPASPTRHCSPHS